jgi:hypothetical protein
MYFASLIRCLTSLVQAISAVAAFLAAMMPATFMTTKSRGDVHNGSVFNGSVIVRLDLFRIVYYHLKMVE